jgi:1-acyl-sn-glycerol-3-phosphate acyltransferase
LNAPGPRNLLEAGARLAAFALWSAAVATAWTVRRLPVPGPARPALASRYTRAWSRGVLRILGVDLRVHGRPPRPPCFLVSNHLGYLDIAVLASQVPCTFVSKREVARWPGLGLLASLAGTLYVDRASHRDAERASRSIGALFGAGGSLALFPEGTTSPGSEVGPFRSPLLAYPAAAGFPVHAAALRYRAPEGFPPAALSMAWWGEAAFLPHFLALFRMRGMRADLAFAPAPVSHPDRKTLAAALRAAVAESLDALAGGPRSSAGRTAAAQRAAEDRRTPFVEAETGADAATAPGALPAHPRRSRMG